MFQNLIHKVIDLLLKLVNKLESLVSNNRIKGVKVLRRVIHPKYRNLTITLSNINNLTSKELLKPIFNCLTSDDIFKDFCKNKIIIITAVSDRVRFNFHPNVLINENTTFNDYYNQIKDHVNYLLEVGSASKLKKITTLDILIWDIDNEMNKHIQLHKESFSHQFN